MFLWVNIAFSSWWVDFPWIRCAGASGFKFYLTFLPTTRRTEEKVVAVSSLVAAAPSGWTPASDTKLHFTTPRTSSLSVKGLTWDRLYYSMMCLPAPPGLWLCVGELALWFPAFAPRPWSWSSVSPPPAGPRHAASPNSHTDCATAPSQPAESTQNTHTHKQRSKMLTQRKRTESLAGYRISGQFM